ncbi:hypothetical protein MGG_15354 [Pyricularia oryzae 70-15]|uniref:Glycosyl transferase n=1 Tax=Pyricularia oryzae (strain 70-15 / ATCC MYA-4617 / FGSC 8958) TaxID=242507 RepID=G4NAP8_PYRO7|nr:uncharacterized protein MGG_15354 [Pyricularia oryzae 70-15]EHA49691.1 hypothetical protein MGG_15354 [Pyricularia oryzae 70-15]
MIYTNSRTLLGRLFYLAVFGLIVLGSCLVYFRPNFPTEPLNALQPQATGATWVDSSSHRVEAAIPPIVHFVQLKKDQGSPLHFTFEAFLALYAAHIHVRPTAIYIHHDFSEEEVANASAHGSSWTKRVLTSLPTVVRLNRVTAPTRANGREIEAVEHRSDFVRLEQLRRLGGGVYLDWDVVTLRPLASLRGAGFRAVVGRQFDAFVNNGIILAAADSAVVRILHRESLRVFDGGWITHSVDLLTRVANALAAAPGEVLIMDFKAFSPFSWEQESVNQLLARHPGEAVPAPEAGGRKESGDVTADALWEDKMAASATGATPKWVYDFSDAVFLHKIFNSVDPPPGYNGVNVPYVLARDSNYAVATWEIVKKGIEQGLIDARDETY